MQQASDIIQIMLTDGTWIGYVCWVIAVLLFFQLLKLAFVPVRLFAWVWSIRHIIFVTPGKWFLAKVLLCALLLWMMRNQVSDGIQYVEQRYIHPAFVMDDTTRHTMAIYEAELSKRLDSYEFETVKNRTHEMAAKYGSTPLAIYEVAYSECGLNPFTIRTDGVAAGWIQFTNAGLNGLMINGRKATLEQVKDACRRRDIETIMDLTDQYFATRTKGMPLTRSVDVYVCVFAPGHIGKPDNQVLYEGRNNPSYYMNKGLDGYYIANIGGRQQIFRSQAACDGRITIQDMALALQAKKSRLIRQYNTFTTSNSSL